MNLKEFINRIAENIFWSYNLEESESQYIIKKETSLITVDKEWLKNKLSVLESYELHKFNLYKITEHNEATSFETSIEIEKNFYEKIALTRH